MSRRRLSIAGLTACAGILLAGAASANGAKAAWGGWSALQAGLGLSAAPPLLRVDPDLTRLRPVSGRAIAQGFAGVKLWASGVGYAVGRRSAGYGLQGGASVELDEGIDLTASYRLTGFALGDRLDPELSDVEERSGAPFVGLDIEF